MLARPSPVAGEPGARRWICPGTPRRNPGRLPRGRAATTAGGSAGGSVQRKRVPSGVLHCVRAALQVELES
ncbi:hypothetical protein ACPA9J_31380 [Pseudomonas aeruginosa]